MEPRDQNTKASSESQPEQGGAANPMMMGMGMMKKMMGQMGSQPGSEAGNPMQQMMGMCVGMCSEMLAAIHKTTSMAAVATPELHTLFAEWMESLEREALTALGQQGEVDAAALATTLKISEASAIHLATHLASTGKVHLSISVTKDK